MIDGWVASEFEPVLDAFAANFDEHGEVGAAVCVYVDGRPVVDLWGGLADATTGRPWAEDTVVPSSRRRRASPRSARTSLIERGLLDPDATGRDVLARVRGATARTRSPCGRC